MYDLSVYEHDMRFHSRQLEDESKSFELKILSLKKVRIPLMQFRSLMSELEVSYIRLNEYRKVQHCFS